jgi:hypothetical protein
MVESNTRSICLAAESLRYLSCSTDINKHGCGGGVNPTYANCGKVTVFMPCRVSKPFPDWAIWFEFVQYSADISTQTRSPKHTCTMCVYVYIDIYTYLYNAILLLMLQFDWSIREISLNS